MTIYKFHPGLGDSSAYQVSGKPFLSGGVDVSPYTSGPLEISFPSVTRWISVTNHDETPDGDVKVAFSAKGFDTNNYFTVSQDVGDYTNTMTQRLELKVTKMYLTGACTNCDIIAGLTGISNSEIANNWSGSAGVG